MSESSGEIEFERNYYEYDASQALAGVACALFAISTITSIVQMIKCRAWVWTVMIIALLAETIGFATRVISIGKPTERNIYVLQFTLIILAPVLMAGVIYVVFGRLVFHIVPKEERKLSLLWVPPRFITPIFVAFDVFALLLQAAGAVMLTAADVATQDGRDQVDRGRDIALAGIGVQLVAFGLFSVAAIRFHFTSRRFIGRMNEMRDGQGHMPGKRMLNPRWTLLLYTVNLSCLLIFVRSIFRAIEFGGGRDGYVHHHEWPFYVFDALPILVAMASYNVFFPGRFLPHLGFRKPKPEDEAAKMEQLQTLRHQEA